MGSNSEDRAPEIFRDKGNKKPRTFGAMPQKHVGREYHGGQCGQGIQSFTL